MGICHRLIKQEICTPVGEKRKHTKFFSHGAQGRRVSARDDAGENVDVLREFHPSEFLDIGVGASRFVRCDGLDLPLPEKPTLCVDLLSGKDMPLV